MQQADSWVSIFISFVVIAMVILGVIIALATTSYKAKKEEAYAVFQSALKALTKDPTNLDLKVAATLAGRQYARYSGVGSSETPRFLYDEAAITNDINTAIERGTPNVAAPVLLSPDRNREERLAELHDLWSKGLMTEEEYADHRHRILSEI